MNIDADQISENLYGIKSLVVTYRNYASTSNKNETQLRSAQKEMKLVKKQILEQLVDLQKVVKKFENRIVRSDEL